MIDHHLSGVDRLGLGFDEASLQHLHSVNASLPETHETLRCLPNFGPDLVQLLHI